MRREGKKIECNECDHVQEHCVYKCHCQPVSHACQRNRQHKIPFLLLFINVHVLIENSQIEHLLYCQSVNLFFFVCFLLLAFILLVYLVSVIVFYMIDLTCAVYNKVYFIFSFCCNQRLYNFAFKSFKKCNNKKNKNVINLYFSFRKHVKKKTIEETSIFLNDICISE